MEKEVKLYIKLTLDEGFATSLRGHRTSRGQHAVKEKIEYSRAAKGST